MADYKVVLRADETTSGDAALLWEPSCPVMLAAVQVSRNVQTSEAYLQVKIRNVSDRKVGSVRGIARIGYSDGSIGEIALEDLDIDLAPRAQGVLKAIALPRGDVESASVEITQAVFPEGKWKSAGEPVAVPERVPLSLDAKAMAERVRKLVEAGVDEKAYGFAVQDHGDWWLCACGQPNVGAEACCVCGSSKSALQSAENESALLASADEWAEAVREKAVGLSGGGANAGDLLEAARLFRQIEGWEDSTERALECEARAEKLKAASASRTKKVVGIAAAVVAAVAVVCLFVVNVAIPDGKYNEAMKLVEAGQYDEAVAAFEELGGYRDSEAQIISAYTSKCASQISAGDFDGAMATIDTLKNVDADDQTINSIAKDASAKALEQENYVEAVAWFDLLNDSDGKQKAEYAYASSHLDKNDTITYQYLLDLKSASYKDSAKMYSRLFDWQFEFAVCTYDASKERGWVDMDSWDQKYDSRGRKTMSAVDLLVRATGGPPNQSKELKMDAWKIKAKTQLGRTDDWVKTNSGDWGNWQDSITVTSDGEIARGLVGWDSYCEAFKVSVSDPYTGKVLYEKEIYRNE